MAVTLESTIARLRRLPAASGRAAARIGTGMLRAVIAARLRQLARTLRHRREAHILAGLDDRMLADIGVNRADLRDAFSEPMWRDPTAMLDSRVNERRVNGRGRAPAVPRPRPGAPGFTRPPVDRQARLSR